MYAVPAPRFLILATAPDFRAMREVGAEIGLLVFGMTRSVEVTRKDVNRATFFCSAAVPSRMGILFTLTSVRFAW